MSLRELLQKKFWSTYHHNLRVVVNTYIVLQIIEEGSWAEAVSSALIKVGCRLLDSTVLNPVPAQVRAYSSAIMADH